MESARYETTYEFYIDIVTEFFPWILPALDLEEKEIEPSSVLDTPFL